MITVTTKLLAAEGREDALLALLRDLCAQMVEKAPGCRRSEVSRSSHDDRRFLLLWCFEDAGSHVAHANSDAYAQLLPSLMELLEGLPDIELYEDP